MNDDFIVTAYVVIDTVMQQLEHRTHPAAQITDAEVVTVAVVAAKDFQHHHERALQLMQRLGYLSGRLSPSRFSRRLHALADWLRFIPETLGTLFATGEAFILDSLPIPVCRRARPGVLRLLRRQAGAVLRLAPASALHRRGRPRGLRSAPRRLARLDAGP